jgi:hypothetical protein
MTERTKVQWLIGLLLAAGVVYWREETSTPTLPGVLSADTRFLPLSVKEPALQVNRLSELQKDEYSGAHRNIFVAGLQAAPAGAAAPVAVQKPFIGPMPPPPPAPAPPLQVPVEFYGVESSNGKKVALFKNGDDPLIVAEGATFLNRFRLVRIANTSADVEEISTGRHATVPLVQPDDGGGAGAAATAPVIGGGTPLNAGPSRE